MSNFKWVVDEAHPAGWLVPLTPAEEAQLVLDRAAGAAHGAEQDARDQHLAGMKQSLTGFATQALTLADALAAGTATAAQQRQGLEFCLRSIVRLSRIVFGQLDQEV